MNILPPTRQNLEIVASYLRNGRHAILPTETVYGLAADATNEAAVSEIFELKKRPKDNPLIVHVSSYEQINEFAEPLSDTAMVLAATFMPGPLTLVVKKRPHVSMVVTGGLDTVAIRMPDHPVCLAVMELGQIALAMPSANLFMELSPTNVSMIDPLLGERVSAIVDGGASTFGIESTVLDVTGEPTILRPGSISQEEIESVLKTPISQFGNGARRSPGMYRRHYSPRTKCTLTQTLDITQPGLVIGETHNSLQIAMPSNAREYARVLYASLAEMDVKGLDEFFIAEPPEGEEWVAVWDRLIKATAV